MSQIFRKLGWMAQRSRKEAELRDELQFHLQEEAEQAEAAGLTTEQAKSAARRELGNVTLLMEDTRATWGWIYLERFWQDLRYAVRTWRRNPGFAAAAILSLTLGIGANTAIFSLLNAVVFRLLPVADPQQLVQFTNSLPLWETGGSGRELYSYPQLERFQAQSKTLSGIFGWTGLGRINVGFHGTSGIAQGDASSDNFFSVLEITPQYGRFFSAGEDRAGASVAVIGDRYWRNRFGADPSIIGGAITVNQIPFTVIGITPREFSGIAVGSSPDIWVPLHALDRLKPDSKRWTGPFSSAWMLIAGRLRPGISRQQAQAELDVIHRRFLAEQLSISELGGLENVQRFAHEGRLVLRPAASGMASGLRDRYAFPLKLLMSVAGIVLLVACANIANLLLARASNRRREFAVRLALGASRRRLVRQLLTESIVLALAGGFLAVPMAWWGSLALVRMISTGDSRVPLAVDPDWRIFAFTAAVSLLTGILFGLAPAVRSTRADPGPVMKEGARHAGRSSHTLDRTLVVAQVALSVVLVTGAGLFLRTLQKLWSVNLGYDRENVLMFSVDAKLAGYPSDRAGSVYREILRRLQALPGVKSASASIVRPVDDQFYLLDRVDEIDGRRLPERECHPRGVECHQSRLFLHCLDAGRLGTGFRATR